MEPNNCLAFASFWMFLCMSRLPYGLTYNYQMR